jgi:diguanylate cyclase (GGDEF)-like protein
MKLQYQQEAESSFRNVQKSYEDLKKQDEAVRSRIGILELRFSDLSRVYEITRHLGKALDLQGLFEQLGEVLYQTAQISSCWFVQLKLAEGDRTSTYRLTRLRDHETKTIPEETGFLAEEISRCLNDKQSRIQLNERMLFPLLVEDRLRGIWIVESANPQHYEALSIIAGQLALTLEKVELYDRIQELAVSDGLTDVYVRRHFLERLQEEFNRSRQQKLSLAVLMCDLDYFKQKNDAYGHLVGDEVLRSVAGILKQNVREVDLVGRYGGEEFSIAMPETSLQGGWQVGERIRLAVQESEFQIYDEKIRITISIGVAVIAEEVRSMEELIDEADHALYSAKIKGRNRVEVYE